MLRNDGAARDDAGGPIGGAVVEGFVAAPADGGLRDDAFDGELAFDAEADAREVRAHGRLGPQAGGEELGALGRGVRLEELLVVVVARRLPRFVGALLSASPALDFVGRGAREFVSVLLDEGDLDVDGLSGFPRGGCGSSAASLFASEESEACGEPADDDDEEEDALAEGSAFGSEGDGLRGVDFGPGVSGGAFCAGF